MAGQLNALDTEKFSKAGQEFYDFLRSRMIGQERAIRKLVRAYELYRSPFHNSDKPAVFMIFTGPSGVGKTFLARLATEFFLRDPNAMTKIDCTRVTNGHEVAAWLGSPAGYVGNDKSGELAQEKIDEPASKVLDRALRDDPETSQICADLVKSAKDLSEARRRDKDSPETAMRSEAFDQKNIDFQEARNRKRPKLFFRTKGKLPSVVLFDEIEKAHPNAYNVLMEIADAGQIKMLNTGETTSFADTFVFLTSNAGSGEIEKELKRVGKMGFGGAKDSRDRSQIWKIAIHELGKVFRPEFIGRCRNNIVAFQELEPQEIQAVAELQLRQLIRDFKRVSRVYLNISKQVAAYISEEALQHPEYGARPVRQKIEDELRVPLTMLVGSEQIGMNDRIFVGMRHGKVSFEKIGEAKEAERPTEPLASYSTIKKSETASSSSEPFGNS